MHCIGVDVSKQDLVAYDGQQQRVFPNDRGLTDFRRFVRQTKNAFIVFEPTSTYSRRLESFCRMAQIPCCQLNPRVVPHLRQVGKGRSKTDSTDAELLYRYGVERGHRETTQLTRDALADSIQAWLGMYRVTQKSRVAYQNMREALSHDPGIPASLLKELDEEIHALKAKEKAKIREAEKLITDHEDARRSFENLLSVPGIGPITALTLLVVFRRYPGTNRNRIVALVGFDPIQFQSGTSVHRNSRISKRGNREVRRRLFEATLAAARYNPGVRAIYKRLKAQGKPDKVARIAAARKLLLIAHAIFKSGDPFRTAAQLEG